MRLHEKLGINARLSYCPICGRENNEILMLGNKNKVFRCGACGHSKLGAGKHRKCPECKSYDIQFVRELDDWEKIPGSICSECQEIENELDRGGIYCHCESCEKTWIVPAEDEMSVAVRESLGVLPPNRCGLAIKEDKCPYCKEDKNV